MSKTQAMVDSAAGRMEAVFEIEYPVTEKIPTTKVYFGTPVEDPYQWLENDTAANTVEWVKAQNITTQSYLMQIPYRDSLRERLKLLSNYPKLYTPMKAGKYIFYKKNDGLQNQPVIYCKEMWDGSPYVLLNPNEMDKAGTTAVDLLTVSEDHKYLAVNISKAGSDWSQIRIIDLETRKMLPDVLDWVKFSGAEWSGEGFFYSRYPEPGKGSELSGLNENMRVYYHRVGQPQFEDRLVYEDTANPKHFHYTSLVGNNRYLVLYKSSGTDGFETYYQDQYIRMMNAPFVPLFQGFDHKNTVAGFADGKFLVHTNVDAPNYKLVAVDPAHPEKENWKTIVPESQHTMEKAVYHNGKVVLLYLENAQHQMYTINADGSNREEVNLPGTGTVDDINIDKAEGFVFYTFTSYLEPPSAHFFDIRNAYSQAFFKSSLTFDPKQFTTEQVWYTSKDGTKVPMFVLHKKDLVLDGSHPCLLYGYGGFNISETPSFSVALISLLQQGAVIALPNLRGGGEYGEKWHQAGMLMKKQNVFDDFISAAEFLIEKKYTKSDLLAISGGSNGGLLVGACMTQRPELFKVAFPAVGVLDMLKYQNFTIGWAWVPEYGSSNQSREMFQYLYNYSPYHQLKPGTHYPATMVTTGDHDDRVVPAHSFKFAARLQEYHQGDTPVLIRIETNAGHGAGKSVSKYIMEVADKWSFFLWNIGVRSLK